MQFVDALQALKDGKYMCLDAWEASLGYLVLMPDMPYIWKIIPMPNPNAGTHTFSLEDLCADDWVLYPKAVKLEEVKQEDAA